MIQIFDDEEALSVAAADELSTLAQASVRARGRFLCAVSGGKTPGRLYELLSTMPWRGQVPWGEVELFWVDERCVSTDSPESNYRLVHDKLLSRLGPDAARLRAHRIAGEHPDPDAAARAYEDEIRRTFAELATPPTDETPPSFDLVLLGMGTDGHTASLFPGHGALDETVRWVVPSEAPVSPVARITMTLPLLSGARAALFLVSGSGKSEMLAAALRAQTCVLPPEAPPPSAPSSSAVPPAGRVVLAQGTPAWFVDRAAASSLPTTSLPAPRSFPR